MATVTFDKASRVYPGTERPAVDALDLHIEDGEFLVLVGPSGCGKSTSLRMLAGLEDVNAGAIRIGDRDVTHLPPKDRDIAMVFQNYALYPHMTVAGNMGFGLKLRGLAKPAVREPRVFLMDEPLSNLDAKLRVQTRSQIAELQRRLGITTVYVTHDQVEAMTMGNRVAVLAGGHLQQCDTPRQLYDNPVNQFVAGFIGSPAMNLQTVPLTEGGARLAGTVIPLPTAVRTAASQAGLREIVLGIRPEHLHLANGSGPVAGEVMLVEELGADALLHVRLAEDHTLVVARTEGRKPPAPGQQITFSVQPDDVFAFHPETGARLAG